MQQGITATDPAGPAARLGSSDQKVSRGQMIGRFIVIDPLGAGAGGVVVSAYDPDLDRKVALKVLRPEHVFSGSIGRARERLLREAKAVARITHPNIITVHEVGSVGDQVFVAMEYVDGGTLRDTLSLRRRDWRQALALLVPAARGLDAAHRAGLVHRDFKPANVLVSRKNRVVVSDFGLVSTSQEEQDSKAGPEPSPRHTDPSLTDTGTTLGTPAYMAPEQHRGANVDPRSDQFAFCVALFEALHGARPFIGNTLLELMEAKESGAIVRPSGPDVPSWLRAVVNRGLSSDADKRFESMAELIGEIERNLKPPSRRGWLGLAAVALVVPAAILGYRALLEAPVDTQLAELAALQAVVAQKDDELANNRRELAELRTQPRVDPAELEALRLRNAEVSAELERAEELLAARTQRRPAKATRATKASSALDAARRFEIAPRVSGTPTLPDNPEQNIVSSVFRGMRPAIERCAGIPDLGSERSYEEWQAVMNRPIDYQIGVSLKIEPTGRASKVRVSAKTAGVRTCIALAVRRSRFPVSIEGGVASYRYSLID